MTRSLIAALALVLVSAPLVSCDRGTTPPDDTVHRSSTLGPLCDLSPLPYACTEEAHRGASPYVIPPGTRPGDKHLCCSPAALCVEIAAVDECPPGNVQGLCPDENVMDHGDGIYSCDDD